MKQEEVMCISSSEDEKFHAGKNIKSFPANKPTIKTNDVVFVSSSSEDETSLAVYNHSKYIKPLLVEAKKFCSIIKFTKDEEFPLDAMKKMIQVAREILKKMESDLMACSMIWDKLLRYLLLTKSFHENQLDMNLNRTYKLEMVYLMADYLAFRCRLICKETHFLPLSQAEIQKEQEKIFQTMAIFLNYKADSSVDSMIMTLIRIETTKAYAVILYKIYEKVLSDKNISKKVYEKQEFVALMLCYKKWKCLVNYKDEKLKINEIAERVLPSKIPSVHGFHKAFHNILPDIPAHKKSKSMRFLLVNQLMVVDDVCINYFKVFEKLIENEFMSKFTSVSCWKTTDQSTLHNQLKLPTLPINCWVPIKDDAFQHSESEDDSPEIVEITKQEIISPQEAAVLRKQRVRKRKRGRKNNNQNCNGEDSVDDEAESARGWIRRKKMTKQNKKITGVVFGEVSSTTNVDIDEPSSNANKNSKMVAENSKMEIENITSFVPPSARKSQQIMKVLPVAHQKDVSLEYNVQNLYKTQENDEKKIDLLEKNSLSPKSEKTDLKLEETKPLASICKSNEKNLQDEINHHLLQTDLLEESKLTDTRQELIPEMKSTVSSPKLDFNTDLQLNWPESKTSKSPSLFQFWSPEETSLADDASWSQFNNDFFTLDATCMFTENSNPDVIPETIMNETGILSEIIDRLEFPELNNHVNMAQICENREWRKISNQDNIGSGENKNQNINIDALNLQNLDSNFYF